MRAQLLATEHWSLLATRGTTWSEVMSRITIHLTVSSASLVVLALVVQASGFGTEFDVMSVGLAAAILVLGTLTAVRVHNASTDDAAMILGMNRLRAAYAELDPTITRFLVTGTHDDLAGISRTYAMGFRRSTVSHVVGSTAFFMTVVNSIVAGTLGALVTHVAGGSTARRLRPGHARRGCVPRGDARDRSPDVRLRADRRPVPHAGRGAGPGLTPGRSEACSTRTRCRCVFQVEDAAG